MQDSATPTPPAPETPQTHTPRSGLFALAIGAVGVVFGDIGTSPLYAMKESFGASPRAARSRTTTWSASCRSCSGR